MDFVVFIYVYGVGACAIGWAVVADPPHLRGRPVASAVAHVLSAAIFGIFWPASTAVVALRLRAESRA